MERRDTTSAVARPRLKRVEKGGRRLVGYAAIFYDGRRSSEYPLKPGTVERISRTAFDATLKRGDDVLALFNHESGSLLGRVASGTMKLRADTRGLRYEIDLPDTQLARELREYIRRGDVSGSSFAFVVDQGGETWTRTDGGLMVRELRSVRLRDVGPVVSPAYAATTATVAGPVPARARRSPRPSRQAIHARARLVGIRHRLDLINDRLANR